MVLDRFLAALSGTRWPLLLIGLTVMLVASGMFEDGEEKSDARALMLGVGAILLGAGLVRLVYADSTQHRQRGQSAPDQPVEREEYEHGGD